MAGRAAGLEISGSAPTQKRSGLDSAFGVARRISRSPRAALVAMDIFTITVSIIAGLAVRFGGFSRIFQRICSPSAASAAVQTPLVPGFPRRLA